jgi:glyoxylase-like metal-dependent hydrolase (beta-lactamase superfamily II)
VTRVHHLSVGDLEVTTIVSGAPWNQNCYLIRARQSASFLVVDPGFDSPELRASIEELGPRPEHVLVTHGHPDHLGAAAALSSWLDVDCRLARADERVARHAPAYAAAFGGLVVQTPDRIEYLDPDSPIRFGNTTVAILPSPGHTPGSVGFDLGDIVLTGDTLFREHVGRTDFPGSDPRAIHASIDRLLADRDAGVRLLAGHGRPWTVGEARDWWTSDGRPGADLVAT